MYEMKKKKSKNLYMLNEKTNVKLQVSIVKLKDERDLIYLFYQIKSRDELTEHFWVT